VSTPFGRSALIVAHPGHELRIHGWLEQARPRVFVLTDGSGSTRESRLESTRRVLRAAGASEGSIFGRFTDRQLYEAVRRPAFDVFTDLVDELAASLVAHQIELVVSDAREEYNSAHDLCRALVDSAVRLAEHVVGRAFDSRDFLLVGRPDERSGNQSIRLTLDDAALGRKLDAARDYPEMAAEVEAALERFGPEAFRVECLRPVAEGGSRRDANRIPFYEQYGEQQVAAGLYAEVIRARDHMDPLFGALGRHVEERTGSRAHK
jgi:hypothetical protein